ncbi:MerR family transcriptional regulator [Actinoplanes utahensis]|uniref:MerR family transcriptional regulator n=1 Tax=Actinoplanes utahensis TaxID=1869 RepID=UPI0022875D6B|nr:MerR family transcriptional regulator [Actinoplanes utahensis]
MGDAAAAAGTTPRAVRYYEADGLLPPPGRTSADRRVHTGKDIVRVRVIRELPSLGLTVADLRACADRLDLLDGDALPAGSARPEPAPTRPGSPPAVSPP